MQMLGASVSNEKMANATAMHDGKLAKRKICQFSRPSSKLSRLHDVHLRVWRENTQCNIVI